jgi:hypothetical protein
MQPMTTANIYAAINEYMQRCQMPAGRWYVGITGDVDTRLFGAHNVSKQRDAWIVCRAINSQEARAVEAAYHRAGCKGDTGGGDYTAVFVYAYVITGSTVE